MKYLFGAVIALGLMSAPAMASPYDYQQGHGPEQNQHAQQNGHDWNGERPDMHASQSRHQYFYQGKQYEAHRGPEWKAPKGHNPHVVWSRGDRLPKAYRTQNYVIDYRAYHLNRPPHGYQWVRVHNDVFLVAISDGVISNIIINLFY